MRWQKCKIIAEVLIHDQEPSVVKQKVKDLKSNFEVIRYCFNEDEQSGYLL